MRFHQYFGRFRKSLQAARGTPRPRKHSQRLFLELLEDRTLFTISLGGIPSWVAEGPAPITDGAVGAINAIAVDPMNAKHLFAATVNGGIWQTADFTVGAPTWTTTTDLMPSLAIESIAFSPVSSNVIYAGTGSYSSIGIFNSSTKNFDVAGQGGAAVGVYKSIDGGASWQIENPNGIFSGRRILRIIPTTLNGGQTVFAATSDGGTSGGVFRSDDGGGSWTRLSGGTSGLPNTGVTDLVENPNNANQFFAATSNLLAGANAGVYELDVTGGNANWVNVTNNMLAGDLSTSSRIELAISPAGANPIWASVINATQFDAMGNVTAKGEFYQRVYRGVASGTTVNWTQVGPASGTVNQPPDILTGNQGNVHGAIAADPNNDTLVYLSGDRPAYVVRGDSTANTWTSLTPAGGASGDPGTVVPANNPAVTTAPHADSRGMVFASGGVLLYASDGGVYQATSPSMGNQTWTSINGTIQDTEFYDGSYDRQFQIIMGGSQDNGTPSQDSKNSLNSWKYQGGGDGGATRVDDFTLTSMGQSVRYFWGGTGLPSTPIRRWFNGPNSRVGGANDNDGFILPAAGLAGLTNAAANDLFSNMVVNATAPTAAQLAAGQSTRVVVAGGTSTMPTANPVGALYESSDAGKASETMVGSSFFVNDNWTQITTPAGFVQASAMAYGGRLNGLDNPDVLYVASGNQIFLRQTAGGTLNATTALPKDAAGNPAGTIVAIALDPNNWQTAFVTDNTHVYMTTDKGANWKIITGNLTNPPGARGAPAFLSVIAGPSQDAVLFGGTKGVFRMLTNTPSLWTKFGAGLANAFVNGMVYNAADDVLVVTTYGRGAWELPSASTFAFLPGVLEINGDTDFPGENDTIKLKIDASNPALLDVFLNSTTPVDQVPIALLNQINVNGLGGNNTLIIDSSNGLISVPNGIEYNGGTGGGFNTLQLVQTGGTTQTSDIYSPGPNPGQGTDVISGPSGTQTVFFSNLAPVTDLVPVFSFFVNGTPANNAISYGPGLIDPVNDGLVTVDNFESIEFANKGGLSINSGLGTDTISINDPSTPTGLINISVMGGDPNANDALFVTGVASTIAVDTFGQNITGATGTGGGVSITYSNIRSLSVTAGFLTTTMAVSGSTSYVYTPGTAADGGSIQTDFLPISFSGFGPGTTLALTGSVPTASLVANGTTANDTFTVAATTGNITLAGRTTIAPTSIANLTLNGLDGGDTFNITSPQPYTSITLGGGGALAGDVANLSGDGTPVVASLGGSTASVSGGDLGSVSLPGIETVNLNAGSGAITLVGTPGPDAFTVNPTGANTATAQVSGLPPVVNVTTTSTLSVNGGGGTDTLTVNGTSGPDTINVSGTQVAVNSFLTVNYVNIAALQVNGLAGSDTFNVTSSATVPINIDGGDPAGATPGDALNVVTAGPPDTVTYTPGPTGDQGSVQVNSNQPISFAHIVSLGVNGAAAAVINGTSANDVITVTARDSSYAVGADGVQDFTVTVNNGANFLFLNTPSLTINALAGNDQVNLKAPAPNLAAWNETVTVDGGLNTVGNQLVVSTPGANQATYTPASANSGALTVTNGAGLVANVTIANIQSFVYDGQSGGDSLTMVGNSAANLFTLKPGAANDAGTLSMDSTLPVAFQNLGAGGQVVVNGNGGADTLVYYGVAANDSFTVSSNPLGGQVNLNARVPVITEAVPTLTLQGVAGGDTFTLVPTIAASPYTTLNLQAGNLAAGDAANLKAAAAADVNVSAQTVSQSGKTVAGSGLASINLNGAGNRLIYSSVAGPTENINVLAAPTANQGQVSVPGVVLVTFVNVPTILVNGIAADNDTVAFTGTNNNDVFLVNLAAAGTVTDRVLKLKNTAGATLLTLQNYTGFATLNILGLDGADTFNVYTAPVAPGRQIAIDDELPAGKKKFTDVLNVFYVFPKPKITHSTSTQDPDAGLVSLTYKTAFFLIQFDGIQKVTIQKIASVPLLSPLQNSTGFSALAETGLASADTVNLSTNPTAPEAGRQIFIAGELPNGQKDGSDLLHLFSTVTKPKIVPATSTHDPDAGLVWNYPTAFFLIRLDDIENATIQKG